MLEPVAAVILNTVVLCGRAHPERSAPLQSVVKVMKTTSNRSITSDFFIPKPRRVKGKQRATGDIDDVWHTLFPSECAEWSCRNQYVMAVPKPWRWVMMKEVHPTRDRPSKRPAVQRNVPSIRRHNSSRLFSKRLHPVAQVRHASGMSERDNASDPGSSSSRSSSSSLLDSIEFPNSTSSAERKALYIGRLRRIILVPTEELNVDKAWALYDAVKATGGETSLNVHELLGFCDKILVAAELKYETNLDVDKLYEWSRNLYNVLKPLDERIELQSFYDHWHKCTLARTHALMGKIQEAIVLLDDIRNIAVVYEQSSRAVLVYRSIVSSLYLHNGSPAVVDFVVDHWDYIGSYLWKSNKWHSGGHAEAGHLLRKTAHELIARIERPVSLMVARERLEWDPEKRRILGELLVQSYCMQKLPLSALDVLHEMDSQSISASFSTKLLVVRALVKEDSFGPAKELFASIPDTSLFKYYLQTALYLFAHDGDDARAETYYNKLVDQGWVNEVDVAMLLQAYATQGRTEQVSSLFDSFFPIGEDGKRTNSPSRLHFAVALYAHAQIGDVEGINKWLEELVRAQMSPHMYIFTMILQAFAKRGEMDHVATIITQMREHGHAPNVVTYTTIMTLLANRKDPVGVETLYKRALREGVVPDLRMVTALLNAHVEAGSWKGVIRAFDYINSNPRINIRLTVEVFNTLLKAYVVIGAPFRVVLRLFKKLENTRLKADSYTYALLIQSACDSGRMDIAMEIFHEMDQRADWKNNIQVNVYVMTILMAGYLRTHNRERARAIHDEMRHRKIRLDAITFHTILVAYGNDRSQVGIHIAEDFVKSLATGEDKSWIKPTYGRVTALELIYGPLLRAYEKRKQPEEVERVFQEYLEAGGKPSLGTLTALLDTYRKAFDIEQCVQLWPEIVNLGLKYAGRPEFLHGEEEDASQDRLQANILCVPLSIYIDTLSAAGRHLEIAEVWRTFQVHGFQFDSHNWNHLVIALVRAGEPERAFQILEKVILPYQEQAREILQARDEKPDSPLSFDKSPDSSDTGSHELHTSTFRRFANMKVMSAKIRGMPEFGDTPTTGAEDPTEKDPTDLEEVPDQQIDYVHPLHILHQISPAWNLWRPHHLTLRALLHLLNRLRAGYPVRPIVAGQQAQDEELDSLENRMKARDTLERIYANNPNTIRLLRKIDTQERRRLGEGYDKKYAYV
ncbi:hypothetical protein D9758_004858 [Tetrapyrgos nigripes]|uniref:Pentatricopeptide repeat-containing protein n=1 Tax=Tetrapyrgos nigripes TaxID=182062 RepID=A0A8H5G627_9AGAR|nr:hypothetical protein D9758_004858 [Tetrapyrgos nigripes]